jgi:hypothetical protein
MNTRSKSNRWTESNRALAEHSPNFRALSVRDLLDARDQYHYHLMNKANVVGTAVGLYLFRKGDVAAPGAKKKAQGERRFDNSAVGDASWPSVLVLVNEWIDDAHFGGSEEKHEPFEMVPKTLFLPDGRTVPVCVVKVSPVESIPSPIPKWHWPGSLLGGGVPINVSVQGRLKTATAGCLVSDGHTTYALTNRHVCGPAGTGISAVVRNRQVVIGRSSARQLTRLLFNKLYPGLPMRSTYVNLEVGLIELENVNDWTSQVYGLGPIGPLLDLNDHNLSLRLIGQEVVAHGAHSGELSGRIQALFYRYKSVGGYEYVSDFLIAPAAGRASTQPGDSGTVWHLAPKLESDRPLPLAVEWGGQSFAFPTGTERLNFALATTLSNVCHLLNVELVQEHNTGVMPYWGQTGHYSIASFAASFTGGGKLGTLIDANLDRISFARGDLDAKRIKAALKDARDNGDFVPLADVPDLVWKNFPNSVTGGRDNRPAGHGRSTGPEHPTHYADIDEPRPSDGKTLRQMSLADPTTNLTVKFWQAFYDECGHPSSSPTRRGLLPFRVWQFHDAMVVAVQQENVADYVCAAGLLAHYVGDACQPLHGSMLADGFPQQNGENGGQRGQGVHSVYETKMIDRFATDLVAAIATKVAQLEPLPEVTSGAGAALATVELMDRSAKTLPPTDLVNAYIRAGGTNHAAERDALWENFHDETATLMADGARVLGMLWKSAWIAGNGPSIGANKIAAIEPSTLRELYENPAFVPSRTLDEIEPVLQ